MRILIVGAGIGGMTLAALLKQRGFHPALIERGPDFEHTGNMLDLWRANSLSTIRSSRNMPPHTYAASPRKSIPSNNLPVRM